MRIYGEKLYPLRVYVEMDKEEKIKLARMFLNMFYKDKEPPKDALSLFFHDDNGKVFFPAGIYEFCLNILKSINPNVLIEYEKPLETLSNVTVDNTILQGRVLRDYQVECVNKALTYKRGLISAVTSSGKSSMILAIARYLLDNTDGNIIITVPTIVLLNQIYKDALEVGFSENECTLMGDSNVPDYSKRLLFSTMTSMYANLHRNIKEDLVDYASNTKALLIDESSHISAQTWSSVIDYIQCDYILGFSAEPFYGDYTNMVRDLLLRGLCGPVLCRVGYDNLIKEGFISKPYYIRIGTECSKSPILFHCMNWTTINKDGIVGNPSRNNTILTAAKHFINLGKKPLILINIIKHGEQLAKDLSMEGHPTALCTGGNHCTIYRDGREVDSHHDFEKVKQDFRNGILDCMIGSSALDEGVSINEINLVILAGGGKAKLKLIQRIGRSVRIDPNDPYKIAFIIDFQDNWSIVSRSQSLRRKKLYSSNNIEGIDIKSVEDLPKAVDAIYSRRKEELK